MNIEELKARYRAMDEEKLENIARREMRTLRPEVPQIVKDEIVKRGMGDKLLEVIDAQLKEPNVREIQELAEKIKSLDCPICGSSQKELVGGIIRKVRSFIIFSQISGGTIIGCSTCVERERKDHLLMNCILGWWSLDGLFYRTPQAIISHFREKNRRKEISEAILIEFGILNIGEFTFNWEQERELLKILKQHNQWIY